MCLCFEPQSSIFRASLTEILSWLVKRSKQEIDTSAMEIWCVVHCTGRQELPWSVDKWISRGLLSPKVDSHFTRVEGTLIAIADSGSISQARGIDRAAQLTTTSGCTHQISTSINNVTSQWKFSMPEIRDHKQQWELVIYIKPWSLSTTDQLKDP